MLEHTKDREAFTFSLSHQIKLSYDKKNHQNFSGIYNYSHLWNQGKAFKIHNNCNKYSKSNCELKSNEVYEADTRGRKYRAFCEYSDFKVSEIEIYKVEI